MTVSRPNLGTLVTHASRQDRFGQDRGPDLRSKGALGNNIYGSVKFFFEKERKARHIKNSRSIGTFHSRGQVEGVLDLAGKQAVDLFEGKAGGFGDKRRLQSSGEHSSGNNQSFLPGPFFDPLLDSFLNAFLDPALTGFRQGGGAIVGFFRPQFQQLPEFGIGVDSLELVDGHE